MLQCCPIRKTVLEEGFATLYGGGGGGYLGEQSMNQEKLKKTRDMFEIPIST